jgi:ubiquitin-protein ligase E3 C
MHTSFTGSTKKARQVNLQGRVNVNGWSKAAGPASTVAQAQAEREKRALDRRRLNAAKNIQRVWRGHRSRREKQVEWRDQYDAHEQQVLSSGQTLARSPEDLAGQLRLLLRFFNLKSSSDHQRLLLHAERWGTVPPARGSAENDSLLSKLGIKVASALAVFAQVATIKPAEASGLGVMQAPNTYARTIADEIKELRDETQWQAFCLRVPDRYLQSISLIARFTHCTPDNASKVFLALARLIEWAPQPLPESTQGLVAANAINCIVGCSASECASDEPSPISATLRVHSEFVGRLLTLEGLYKLPSTLSAFATATSLDIIATSINLRLEAHPRWLTPQDARNILKYLCYSRRTLNTPETRALSTLVAITTLLELAEQLPEDNELAEAQSIDRFLADIAALPGVDSATTAKIMAKYALSLLRAFSNRAYDIRMRIFLNPTTSTSSGKPLTSIQYFWQASRQTDIFKIVTQSQRNVLPLLKPEFSTETEQIGRRGLAAKLVLQSWKDDWRLILFFFEMYTSALKLMDDEEFFLSDESMATFGSGAKEDNRQGRGSLPLADIAQMVIFLKNLTYTLYWNTYELSSRSESREELTARLGAAITGGETRSSITQPDLAGLEGVTQSYLKGLTTGVLRMLHERDSRRKFLPENSWLMTSQVDMTSFIPEVVHEEEKRLTLGDIEEEVESEDDLDDAAAQNTSDWSSRISGRTPSYGFTARSNTVVNRFVRKQERAKRRNQVAAVAPRLELLRNLPFFIPFETRVNIFRQFVHNDQYRRRNGAIDPHVWRMTVEHMELGRGAGRELLSRHTAKIRRESVFDDAFAQFYPLGEGLKEPIYIKFFDNQGIEERGIDGGGVTKEFLTSITSQAFSPDPPGLSWFVENDQHYLHPNSDLYEILLERSRRLGQEPRSEETLESTRNLRKQYEFMGRVVGKCLYEGILIDVRFAGFFLLKWALTGGTTSASNETAYRATLNDMRDMDPDIYHHLLALKNWTGNVEEDFGLNFTITDNMTIDETGKTFSRTRELIPNGANTPVTNANRLLYIDRFVRYRLQYHPKVVTDAFLKGLGQMIEPMWLAMFNQKELQWLIGGDDNELDLLDLRRNTDLGGIYQRGDDPADHPTIELFWDVLKEMDDRDRREVLRFATSTPRAPLLGFSNLNPRFSIRDSTNDEGRHDLNRLPTSSTCVNQLKLPPYTSKALMREKLLYAARSGAGFDLS